MSFFLLKYVVATHFQCCSQRLKDALLKPLYI